MRRLRQLDVAVRLVVLAGEDGRISLDDDLPTSVIWLPALGALLALDAASGEATAVFFGLLAVRKISIACQTIRRMKL